MRGSGVGPLNIVLRCVGMLCDDTGKDDRDRVCIAVFDCDRTLIATGSRIGLFDVQCDTQLFIYCSSLVLLKLIGLR